MTKQNRNTRSLGPVGAAALFLLLAAGSALAISPDWEPGHRRRAMRESQIRKMDIFARNYGSANWSLVLSEMDAHPADPANPAFMSVPLSLANVYLNRYEVGWNLADLERSLQIIEWVTASRELWGGRDGSGSVVSYLDISLARLQAECDVGEFGSRIDELWRTALAITAEEADALQSGGVPGHPCGPTFWLGACAQAILPFPSEEAALASRTALFAAASSFLAADPRAGAWAESVRSLAVRFPDSVCEAPDTELVLSQGALAYRMAGGDAPDELNAGMGGRKTRPDSLRCAPFSTVYETAGPVGVVTPGDSLARAIRDSRVVAFHLSEQYLWRFPPGSQCVFDGADEDPIRVPRL